MPYTNWLRLAKRAKNDGERRRCATRAYRGHLNANPWFAWELAVQFQLGEERELHAITEIMRQKAFDLHQLSESASKLAGFQFADGIKSLKGKPCPTLDEGMELWRTHRMSICTKFLDHLSAVGSVKEVSAESQST